jgi:uncharacterized protein
LIAGVSAMDLLLYFLLGFIISVMSGFFGVGGGFILTPVLLLMGISPVQAIATSLFFTIGTSISGVWAHFRLGNIYWKYAFIIGISGILSTQIAHPFVMLLEQTKYDGTVIPLLYLVLLGYYAFTLLFGKHKNLYANTNHDHLKIRLYQLIGIGILGGFVSTALGVGGGFIIVPMLISIIRMTPEKAVGTSLAGVLMIVAAGLISFISDNNMHWHIGSMLIAGGLAGGQLGALVTQLFSHVEMKVLLGFLYFTTFISVAFKLLLLEWIGLGCIFVYLLSIVIFMIYRFIRRKGSHERENVQHNN